MFSVQYHDLSFEVMDMFMVPYYDFIFKMKDTATFFWVCLQSMSWCGIALLTNVWLKYFIYSSVSLYFAKCFPNNCCLMLYYCEFFIFLLHLCFADDTLLWSYVRYNNYVFK